MTQLEKRASREERLRDDLFGDVVGQVFDTRRGGFVPVPIEHRKLMRYLTPPQFRVLLYLQLRANKLGFCFPSIDEIAFDIGVAAKKHIRPLIAELEGKGFVKTATAAGRNYFLMLDPAVAISTLLKRGEMTEEELRDINRLRQDLNRESIGM